MQTSDVYTGGALPFQKRFEKSKWPLVSLLSYLPAFDCDLDAFALMVVQAPDVDNETQERAH